MRSDGASTGSVLDRFRLDDRVAVIMGASSGLGVAIARGFAEAGADVVLGARRADRLQGTEAMIRRLGRTAVSVTTDVADPGVWRSRQPTTSVVSTSW